MKKQAIEAVRHFRFNIKQPNILGIYAGTYMQIKGETFVTAFHSNELFGEPEPCILALNREMFLEMMNDWLNSIDGLTHAENKEHGGGFIYCYGNNGTVPFEERFMMCVKRFSVDKKAETFKQH